MTRGIMSQQILKRKLAWLRENEPATYTQLVLLPMFELSDEQLTEQLNTWEEYNFVIPMGKGRI